MLIALAAAATVAARSTKPDYEDFYVVDAVKDINGGCPVCVRAVGIGEGGRWEARGGIEGGRGDGSNKGKKRREVLHKAGLRVSV